MRGACLVSSAFLDRSLKNSKESNPNFQKRRKKGKKNTKKPPNGRTITPPSWMKASSTLPSPKMAAALRGREPGPRGGRRDGGGVSPAA